VVATIPCTVNHLNEVSFAGDWTSLQGGAEDFNAWLGEAPQCDFLHRIVVLGDHEKNRDWEAHYYIVNISNMRMSSYHRRDRFS
jgi:hypothetical protein